MFRYPTYMAVETLTIALVTEDGQSFEDLGIEEREAGQVIIKCRAAEPMRDGAPCEWNKMGSDGYPFCASSTEVMRLREQNAKLREQMDQLVTLLRNDCDIEASWDGLRRFWSIELTEDGCLMRDRACKAEAENAELRQQLADVTESMGRVEERCAKLRELVRHVYECMGNIDADGNHECYSCEYENAEDNCDYERLMRELVVIQ